MKRQGMATNGTRRKVTHLLRLSFDHITRLAIITSALGSSGSFNQRLLKLCGDVEENPGPLADHDQFFKEVPHIIEKGEVKPEALYKIASHLGLRGQYEEHVRAAGTSDHTYILMDKLLQLWKREKGDRCGIQVDCYWSK